MRRAVRRVPRGLFLLTAALALGSAAIVLTAQWLDRAARAAAGSARADAAGTVDLLVAARDLSPGDVLAPDMLATAPWPRAAVLPQHMPAASVDPDRLAGAIVRTAVAAGQPLAAGHLVSRGEQGLLAALIAPGHRAVTIPVTAAAGLAGLLGPGDRVDVLLAVALPGTDRAVARTVLENVRVLGVDGQLRAQPGAAAEQPPSTVTLEVTPEGAETLALAQEIGRLSLALRNLAADRPPVPAERAAGSAGLAALAAAVSGAGRAPPLAPTPPLPATPAVLPPAPAAAAASLPAPPAAAQPPANPSAAPPAGVSVENGVQVLRGSSIRSAPAPGGTAAPGGAGEGA